jgi:ALG11 mannosyltransferase N-terminus
MMTSGFSVGGLFNYGSTELIAFVAAIFLIAVINVLIKSSRMRVGGREELLLAFFHPNCDSGGGGERVLWVMIHALLKDKSFSNKLRICIYSSVTSKTKSEILVGVNKSFRIDITDYFEKITLIPIISSPLLDAKWYKATVNLCP